ncbi:MAG TPA: hypothetical protein VGH56_11175, partial [Solirubrobacteraceae bacterium]
MGEQQAGEDNGAQTKPRRFSWRGLLYSVVSILVPLVLFATVVIAAQGTPQPSCIHETKPDARSVSPDEQPISQSGSLAKQYEPTVK